jgi:hypothetical protein
MKSIQQYLKKTWYFILISIIFKNIYSILLPNIDNSISHFIQLNLEGNWHRKLNVYTTIEKAEEQVLISRTV